MEKQNACRITCRLEVLPGNDVYEQISNAKEFGFDGIALPGRFLNEYLDDLKECAAQSPLPLTSLSLGFQSSLLHPDPKARRDCRDSIVSLLDLCAELQVRLLNIAPVLIQDNPQRFTEPGNYSTVSDRQDALLMDQMPALGDEAKRRDVCLLLEPVNRYESEYLHTIIHAARLCRSLNHSHIGCTADFFHMQIEELQMDKSISHVGKWIRHVHVAENTRVEPGPGSMAFVPGFRALQETGYSGLIEIECRRLSGRAADVLPRSVQYLRQQWQAASPEVTSNQ